MSPRRRPERATDGARSSGEPDRSTRRQVESRRASCSRSSDRVDSRVQDVEEPRQRGQSRPGGAEYGADSLRLYEMFMGPLEAVKPWSMDGVSGVRGFLDRAWRMIVDDRAEAMQLHAAVRTSSRRPSRTACCTRRFRR